jgi:hypothetical protein
VPDQTRRSPRTGSTKNSGRTLASNPNVATTSRTVTHRGHQSSADKAHVADPAAQVCNPIGEGGIFVMRDARDPRNQRHQLTVDVHLATIVHGRLDGIQNRRHQHSECEAADQEAGSHLHGRGTGGITSDDGVDDQLHPDERDQRGKGPYARQDELNTGQLRAWPEPGSKPKTQRKQAARRMAVHGVSLRRPGLPTAVRWRWGRPRTGPPAA